MENQQPFVFKFQRGENLHRASFPAFPTYVDLRQKINQQCSSLNYKIQWIDESGDRISISSQLDLDEFHNFILTSSQKYAKVIIVEEPKQLEKDKQIDLEDEEDLEEIEDMLGLSEDESDNDKQQNQNQKETNESLVLSSSLTSKVDSQVLERLTKINRKYSQKIKQHTDSLEKLKAHRNFNKEEFDRRIEFLKQLKLPYGVWMQKLIAHQIVYPERQKCEKKRMKVDEMVQKSLHTLRDNGYPHGPQVNKILRNWAFNQVFFPTTPDETSAVIKDLQLELPPFVVNKILSKSHSRRRVRNCGNSH